MLSCWSHHLQVTCIKQAAKCNPRPETREMHLILTPGLDVHQRLLCSVDIFTEGNIEISLCIEMEVISYVNFGQNLSQKTRVGLCAKAAGADPLPTQLNPSCPSCETHLGTAALPVSRRIGLHLAEASPNATLRS